MTETPTKDDAQTTIKHLRALIETQRKELELVVGVIDASFSQINIENSPELNRVLEKYVTKKEVKNENG